MKYPSDLRILEPSIRFTIEKKYMYASNVNQNSHISCCSELLSSFMQKIGLGRNSLCSIKRNSEGSNSEIV